MIYSTERQTHTAAEFVVNEGKVQYGIAHAAQTQNFTCGGGEGRKSSDGVSIYFLGLYIMQGDIRVWIRK